MVSAVQKAHSALIDGEAIVYGDDGMPSFDLLHSRQHDKAVSLLAFDLLELDGEELRREPLIDRKSKLKRLLAKVKDGIEFNTHIEGDGNTIFEHVCKLGHGVSLNLRRIEQCGGGRRLDAFNVRNVCNRHIPFCGQP